MRFYVYPARGLAVFTVAVVSVAKISFSVLSFFFCLLSSVLSGGSLETS